MLDWILRRLSELPPWGAGLLVLGGVALVAGGAIVGYQTYDYVEHDNEFCLSCHLMAEPYELFAQSAHRDMGCKACHKPTFAARSQMAISQIVENPDTIATHAEVPNEKCASCHIDGDPEKWETIARSAGHLIHLESDDPSLDGLSCVECHSSSLHQFTAASETCAQSGCHEDSDVQLGGMSDLTIHCTACHGFSEPVPAGTPLDAVIASVEPDAQACLSCHAMRALVEMPPDEPHDAACGACHNPHEQATPAAAVESCATAACHSEPDTLTPMHRGLDPGVLDDCTSCHEAHHWEIEPTDCLSCHQDVFDEPTSPGRIVAAADDAAMASRPTGDRSPGLAAAREAGLVHPASSTPFRMVSGRGGGPSALGPGAAPPPVVLQYTDTAFTHARHREVECTECHSTENSHGQLTVFGLADCRSCHHAAPVSDDCAACHTSSEVPAATFTLQRTMSFSVGEVPSRGLPFDHGSHEDIDCTRCHVDGLALSASAVDCASCHEDHHVPEASCRSCHEEAPAEAHPIEVHRGCGGSGCHEDVATAIQGMPRTRSFCMACHQDLVDHRPGQECQECHRLPDGSIGTAGAP